jgi:WD40 repeat protein
MDTVRGVAYHPDGRLLATAGDDGVIRLWQLPFGAPAQTIQAGIGIEAIAFAPDGKRLAAGMVQGDLVWWDANRWDRSEGVVAHAGGVRSLAYSSNSERLATAGWDRTVLVWDPEKGIRHLLDQSLSAALLSVAFPADGASLAVGAANEVRLYELDELRLRATLQTAESVLAVACSPDGRYVAAGDRGGKVTLWRAGTTTGHAVCRGHTGHVFALAFTPSGRTLFSGGADGTVRLWDVDSGREKQVYRWHERWVTFLAVAPDGMTAAAGSEDHTVVVWDIDDD